MSLLHDLLDDPAAAVVDDLCSAKLQSKIAAVLTRPNCVDPSSAADRRRCNCHQTDRADANDRDIVAELDVSQFCAVESRRHHIRCLLYTSRCV